MYDTDDTIAAIASAPGGAARGLIRISGRQTISILASCFRPRDSVPLAEIQQPTVIVGSLSLADSPAGELPCDLYLWPTARSYTREISAELHTVGSPPLLAAVLATVCRGGTRLAEPGEFTLRAFLAGRLDLAQAEAVLGVIDARGPDELQTALARLAGGLSAPLARLREALIELVGQIEAGLDFGEEDIRFIARDEIQKQLDEACQLVARTHAQLVDRGRREALPTAVLVGCPNAGKSSLFNALAPRAAALVSNQPGTTRDYLTATLDLDGVACQLVDTAGVERDDSDCGIRQAADKLGGAQARDADVQIVCLDSTRPIIDRERELLAANPQESRLVLLTKCDQGRVRSTSDLPCEAIETSAHNGLGLGRTRQALRQAVVELARSESAAHLTADRCADSLRRAAGSLARAAELNRGGRGEELIGSEVRVALTELSSVVGAVYTEDILGRIFSRFCIGK